MNHITCEICGKETIIAAGYLYALCKKGHKTQLIFCSKCNEYSVCYEKFLRVLRNSRVIVVKRRVCKRCNAVELLDGEQLYEEKDDEKS